MLEENEVASKQRTGGVIQYDEIVVGVGCGERAKSEQALSQE
jgi:hypothetical protein